MSNYFLNENKKIFPYINEKKNYFEDGMELKIYSIYREICEKQELSHDSTKKKWHEKSKKNEKKNLLESEKMLLQ